MSGDDWRYGRCMYDAVKGEWLVRRSRCDSLYSLFDVLCDLAWLGLACREGICCCCCCCCCWCCWLICHSLSHSLSTIRRNLTFLCGVLFSIHSFSLLLSLSLPISFHFISFHFISWYDHNHNSRKKDKLVWKMDEHIHTHISDTCSDRISFTVCEVKEQ